MLFNGQGDFLNIELLHHALAMPVPSQFAATIRAGVERVRHKFRYLLGRKWFPLMLRMARLAAAFPLRPLLLVV